jgi:hypothetical protein
MHQQRLGEISTQLSKDKIAILKPSTWEKIKEIAVEDPVPAPAPAFGQVHSKSKHIQELEAAMIKAKACSALF